MDASLYEFINSLETSLLETILQHDAHINSEISASVSETLHRRALAAALREKYPREVLEKMSYEELEKLLWGEVLGKYPAWLTKELLQDIFEIQDSKNRRTE